MNNNCYSTMMSVRHRRQHNSSSHSKANATWTNHIIERDDDDEDDASPSIKNNNRFIHNTVLKPKGISVIKSCRSLASFKSTLSSASSFSSHRKQGCKKYSYKLRTLLHKDLQMAFDIGESTSSTLNKTTATTTQKTTTTEAQSPTMTKTTSSPSTTTAKTREVAVVEGIAAAADDHRRSSCSSLYDEYSKDIEVLLKSLHSTEFVGTIDPQYHSRYVSDECLGGIVATK